MDAATATLIGVAITGVLALIGTIVNNRHQLRQLREQREHEERKAQIESEATRERHMKERLQEIYANAARSLSEIVIIVNQEMYKGGYRHQTPLQEKIGDAHKWLSLVVIYYYGDRESVEFRQFYTSLITLSPQDSGFEGNADHLRRCVIEFAKNDPRLK